MSDTDTVDPLVFLAPRVGDTPDPVPAPEPTVPLNVAPALQPTVVPETDAEAKAAVELSIAEAVDLIIDAAKRMEAAHAALGDAMHDTWKANLALSSAQKRAKQALG